MLLGRPPKIKCSNFITQIISNTYKAMLFQKDKKKTYYSLINFSKKNI